MDCFFFTSIKSVKRFLGSISYSCLGCSITAASSYLLKQTRFMLLSESYQTTTMLISIAGTLCFRYGLYLNKNQFASSNALWKCLYHWVMFCLCPSVFICGFKPSINLYALQCTSVISCLGIALGILLPNRFECHESSPGLQIIYNLVNVLSEYFSIVISCIGCGFITTRLIAFLTNYQIYFMNADTDKFFLGFILVFFSFIIEDVKSIKNHANDHKYDFDSPVTSIPLYIDFIFVYLFVTEFVEHYKK